MQSRGGHNFILCAHYRFGREQVLTSTRVRLLPAALRVVLGEKFFMQDSILRYLIVGPSWVGDMVMAQSLFMRLKELHPSAAIDVLAPAWSEPLLERMPQVRRSIVMPLGHGDFNLKRRYVLGRSLEGQYDRAIILPNSWKSALVPAFAKIPQRSGYRGEFRYGLLNDLRLLDKLRLPMTVQRYVALADSTGAVSPPTVVEPQLITKSEEIEATLQRLSLPRPNGRLLALCPGAEYGPAKRWPAKHYAAVAQYWLDQGGSVWLFGSAKDQAVTAEIMSYTQNACIDLAGRTALGEAIDLMSLADTAVSNDSGLMHVAAALGLKVIAVYGSSDPGFTPPLSRRGRVVSLELACSPCFKRECPFGHYNCLRQLLPERVIAHLGST